MRNIVTDREIEQAGLILPKDYHSSLKGIATEKALQELNRFIESNLEEKLNLHRVNAPLFVRKGTGINDDLNGVESPVKFPLVAMHGAEAEVVQSLAKWKRMALRKYALSPHEGIYTNMSAIRPDERPDNLHSVYVDQWDWELRINKEDRSVDFLKKTVRAIYDILKKTELFVHKKYGIQEELPEEIKFIHTEELLQKYPEMSPQMREREIVKKYKAVFLMGIGGLLSNGEAQDGRSPDYDDWSSPNEEGFQGLNGDIIVWNSVLNQSFELSSMGIRVDKEALLRQLELKNQAQRKDLLFHQLLLREELPLSIGGGIGKSRTGMYFLRKAHIGEVSWSIWPEGMVRLCADHNIELLEPVSLPDE